MYLNFVS